MKAKKLAALVLTGALCMSAFTGCGIDANETVATLGDQEIKAGIANFMSKYQKSMYDDMYVSYYGEDVWSMDFSGDGTTLGDNLKDSIMSTLHDLYTLQNHMSDYGVSLTEEEKTAISEATAAFMKDNSEEAIKEMGATQEIIEEMLTLYTIQTKMYDASVVDVDTEVSDEEGNMRGISMITIDLSGYYDDSYNLVEYTDEEIDAMLADATAMETALETKTLEEVAEEYEYSVKTDAYVKNDEGFDEAVLTAMDALAEGEVSDMIQTDDAIYFVRIDTDLDEEATAENIESIISERESALYDEVMTGWQEDDGWTVNEKVLAKIDMRNILTQTDPNATESESESVTENE